MKIDGWKEYKRTSLKYKIWKSLTKVKLNKKDKENLMIESRLHNEVRA